MAIDKIVFEKRGFRKFIRYFFIFCVIAVIIAGVLGYIGDMQVKRIGGVCDLGFKDILCWKWHKEIVAQFYG